MNGVNGAFTDTNVLLYAFDSANPAKRAAARRWLGLLWQHGTGRLSWQVLHEFYANAGKKMGVSTAGARAAVAVFTSWTPVDTTTALVERAWHWSDAAQLSYWDALIVAAAEVADCRWLLSEDLQHGRTFGSVTVIDPFRTEPGELGLEAPAE